MPETLVARRLKELGRDDTIYLFEGYKTNSICKFVNIGAENHHLFKRIMNLPPSPVQDGDIVILGPQKWEYLTDLLKDFYPHCRLTKGRDPANNLVHYLEYRIPKSDWMAVSGANWEIVDASREVLKSVNVSRLGTTPAVMSEMDGSFLIEGVRYRIRSSLFVPRYRGYTFEIRKMPPESTESSEKVLFFVDGVERVNRLNTPVTLTLMPGRSAVKLVVHDPQPGAQYFVCWDGDGSEMKPIGYKSLSSLEELPYGLVGVYRRGAQEWDAEPITVRQDVFLEAIQDLGFPYSAEWKGRIVIQNSGSCRFGMKADDGGGIWIDGKEVLSLHHEGNSVWGTIGLKEGEHDITVRYYDEGGGQYLEMFWIPTGGTSGQLDYKALLPPK